MARYGRQEVSQNLHPEPKPGARAERVIWVKRQIQRHSCTLKDMRMFKDDAGNK